MFNKSRTNGNADSEYRRPLLDSEAEHSRTLFNADDDSDEEGTSALVEPTTSKSVHFKEDVQVIAPPLRSMTASRETGESASSSTSLKSYESIEFEQDSDELDDASLQDLERSHAPRSGNEQRMPLLVGLFESSASRRSLDSMPMNGANGNSVIIGEDTIDLDEIAAKRTAGGGLFDSIANMANSILGAGKFSSPS